LLKRLLAVVATVAVLLSGATALAKDCTPFGCHPGQGDPVHELGGMIVFCVLLAGAIATFARRYVK